MPTAIDTAKVSDRRQLRFESLDDLVSEVDRLENAREIRTLGNWSAGQVLEHLATSLNKSIDGYKNPVPAVFRVVLRLFMKQSFLTKPLSAGFKLPAKAEAEMWSGSASVPEGAQALRAAIGRLKSQTHREPHPVIGPLSVAEWNQFHCRHAEMHLSFLVPVDQRGSAVAPHAESA
jgi:hypothetical protein